LLEHPSELLLFGLGQLGQLRWWGEQSVARSAQRRIPTAGKHDGLDTAICGRRPPSCEARSLEIVDHRGYVGRIAVHCGGQLAHRLRPARVDRQQSAQGGLRYAELVGNLGPPEALF
jgi:hypothetical protein